MSEQASSRSASVTRARRAIQSHPAPTNASVYCDSRSSCSSSTTAVSGGDRDGDDLAGRGIDGPAGIGGLEGETELAADVAAVDGGVDVGVGGSLPAGTTPARRPAFGGPRTTGAEPGGGRGVTPTPTPTPIPVDSDVFFPTAGSSFTLPVVARRPALACRGAATTDPDNGKF